MSMTIGRSRGVVGLALLGAVTLLVGGCQMTGGGAAGGGPAGPPVSAVRHPTLEDFPLPNGFSLVRDHSQSNSRGWTRWVQYEFSGSAPWSVVVQFFKDTLPSAGWTLRSEGLQRNTGTYDMRYQSEREECELRIRQDRSGTVVNVDIGPLPQGSADRAPAPKQRP